MIALYTRGLWENVDEAELDDVFADADNEVQTTVDNIEELLLSRQPENLDNYTLAVIFVNKIYKNPERRRKIKKIVCITILVVLVLTIICIAVWFWHRKKVQRMEDMNYHFTNTVEYVNTGNYVRAKDECEQAQELAEKLKDHRMRSRLQEYLFLIEMVLLADETYSGKEYETAQEHYLSALDRSRYADNIGKDYIEDKLGRIHAYLSVEDYLALGDALFAQGDYAAAELLPRSFPQPQLPVWPADPLLPALCFPLRPVSHRGSPMHPWRFVCLPRHVRPALLFLQGDIFLLPPHNGAGKTGRRSTENG